MKKALQNIGLVALVAIAVVSMGLAVKVSAATSVAVKVTAQI